MSFRKVKPTKSNLINLQKKLKFATRGETFLEFKRELLIRQIKDNWANYQDSRKKFFKLYKQVLIKLNQNYQEMGKRKFNLISKISEFQYNPVVSINYTKKQGTTFPQINYDLILKEKLPAYSFEGTSHYLDDLLVLLREFMENLMKHAENEAVLQRFAFDYSNLNRRINGLKNIIIPKLETDLKMIRDILEESERENFIRLKKTKDMIAKKQIL